MSTKDPAYKDAVAKHELEKQRHERTRKCNKTHKHTKWYEREDNYEEHD